MRIQLITSCVNRFGEYEYLAKIVIDDSDKVVIDSADVIGKTTIKETLGAYGADVVEEYELDEEMTKEDYEEYEYNMWGED